MPRIHSYEQSWVSSKLTPEDATSPLGSLKVMLSRCITGDGRASVDVKVLGFYYESVERTFTVLHVALLL